MTIIDWERAVDRLNAADVRDGHVLFAASDGDGGQCISTTNGPLVALQTSSEFVHLHTDRGGVTIYRAVLREIELQDDAKIRSGSLRFRLRGGTIVIVDWEPPLPSDSELADDGPTR